jgi:integrase
MTVHKKFRLARRKAPPRRNVRLAAVRLAHEAVDTGLLSPELGTGILPKVRSDWKSGGNRLTIDQSKTLRQTSSLETARGKRDRTSLALLIGCGLRPAELVGLRTNDLPDQRMEIGIRKAVGANRRSIPWMVLRESLWLTAVGIELGLPTAFFGARLFQSNAFRTLNL